MGSMIFAGDIILLQNVKITKFRNVLEAATTHISSLLVLVHSHELSDSKAIDEFVPHGLLRKTANAKLRRVVNWVRRTESALRHAQKGDSSQRKGKTIKNWKTCEEKQSMDRLSVSEALRLTNACHAKVLAYIGEIFMPFLARPDEFEDGQLFVSKRLMTTIKNTIIEDLISQGCKLCGSPMGNMSSPEQTGLPLYCKKGSSYQHDICSIYRPFLMYVRDEYGEMPFLVKNNAAEILFGNISAENVYKCYQGESRGHDHGCHRRQQCHSHWARDCRPTCKSVDLIRDNKNAGTMQAELDCSRAKLNFYRIWLILVKTLLQHDKNSPFCFEIIVNSDDDIENGRFELVSFTMPCYENGKP